MKEPITGVQLYTLRNYIQTKEDFDSTLQRLGSMGVQDIQISAIGASLTTNEIAETVRKYDMRVCVTHQSYERLCNDLPAVMELHHAIGCDAVGLGYAPDNERDNLEHAQQFMKKLQDIALELQKHQLQFHYHNHDFEFRKIPGSDQTLMDLFLKTDPALIHLIPDVAWMHVAGHNPAELLQQISDRVKVVHFKDYVPKEDGRPRFVSLGQGVVNLKECFAACREKELPFVVYEQDDSWENDDPFAATKTSLAFFEQLHRMQA